MSVLVFVEMADFSTVNNSIEAALFYWRLSDHSGFEFFIF